jgi:hypothetical protein
MGDPSWLPLILSPLISAASGLIGVRIGASLSLRRDREERRLQFIKSQLEELYAPLVGLRANILAKSSLRAKIHELAPGVLDPESPRDDEAFGRLIEHANKQLEEDLVPRYQKMVDILTAKIGLAEGSTRAHYQQLVEYVELLNRCLEGSIPRKMAAVLGHTESSLYRLYDDVEENLSALRDRLRSGGS